MECSVTTEEVRKQIIESLKIESMIEDVAKDLKHASKFIDKENREKVRQLAQQILDLCHMRDLRNKAFTKQQLQETLELNEIKATKIEPKRRRKPRR